MDFISCCLLWKEGETSSFWAAKQTLVNVPPISTPTKMISLIDKKIYYDHVILPNTFECSWLWSFIKWRNHTPEGFNCLSKLKRRKRIDRKVRVWGNWWQKWCIHLSICIPIERSLKCTPYKTISRVIFYSTGLAKYHKLR